ncbi:MAG: hypothetical protein ACK5GN_09070 [Pseudomonadota bacterium]|jgi:hypothetical protein
MGIWTEIIENLVAIAPAIVAAPLIWKKPRQVSGWAISLIGSSAIAIIALGLLLKRLTAVCSGLIPSCVAAAQNTTAQNITAHDTSNQLIHRIPGIFTDCVHCGLAASTQLVVFLNQLALPLQAGTAIVCIAISSFTTIRFVLWARKTLIR